MTILAYHSISSRDHPLAVSREQFVRQLDLLQKFRVVPVAEYAARRASRQSTRGLVALTFDDGYRDFAETVAPLLADRRWPATVFIPTALVGKSLVIDVCDWPLMSWDDVRAAAAMGMEIGSHSESHPHLTDVDDAQLDDEVTRSRHELESMLGAPVAGFCYPAGYHDARVVAAVARAGYSWAVVTPRIGAPANNRLTLRRSGIYHHDDLFRVRLKLAGAGRIVTRLRTLRSPQ
jgi:peptidoglycan/xylan/chitin deacetylase (PgdA/CDA1 family)